MKIAWIEGIISQKVAEYLDDHTKNIITYTTRYYDIYYVGLGTKTK